jgi:hypothetical protein
MYSRIDIFADPGGTLGRDEGGGGVVCHKLTCEVREAICIWYSDGEGPRAKLW